MAGERGARLRGDAVQDAVEHELLGVRRVAGEHDARVALDEDREVTRRVAGRRQQHDAVHELVVGLDQRWGQPRGPVLVQVTALAAHEAGCDVPLGARDHHLRTREVAQAARVVGVHVRQDHPADVVRRRSRGAELRPDLVVGRDPLAEAAAVVEVPAREVARVVDAGGLAGVDDDQAVRMLDQPGAHRHRRGPAAVDERGGDAQRAARAAHLARAHGDRAGLDRRDPHAWSCSRFDSRPMPYRRRARHRRA